MSNGFIDVVDAHFIDKIGEKNILDPSACGGMVFNATFNNISVISRWSVLLVEETRVPWENHRPAAGHWQTLSHDRDSNLQLQLPYDHDHDSPGDNRTAWNIQMYINQSKMVIQIPQYREIRFNFKKILYVIFCG